MEKIPDKSSSSLEENEVLNLKETELRLGLPGSEFSEKKATGFSLFGKDLKDEANKNIFSGANKWGLCINGGSEVNLGKNGVCVLMEASSHTVEHKKNDHSSSSSRNNRAQVVGWPPIRTFRKNTLSTKLSKNNDVTGKAGSGCVYVKVSMDGAPYLRKVDLKTYCSYAELSSALEKMFSCFTIGKYDSHGVGGKEELSDCHLMGPVDSSACVLTFEDKDGDWMLVGDVPWEMFTASCKRLRIMKGSEASGLAPRVIKKCKSQN